MTTGQHNNNRSATSSRSQSPLRTVSPPPCPVFEGTSVNPDLWTHKMVHSLKNAADDKEHSDSKKRLITIDDIVGEVETDKHHKVSSPRSIQACLQLGIDPTELQYRPVESFHGKGLSQDLLQIKYEHYEKIRKEKISKLQTERAKIIQKQDDDQAAASSSSGPSTSKYTLQDEKMKKEAAKEQHRLEVMIQAEVERERHIEQLLEKAEAADHVHQNSVMNRQAEQARKVVQKQLELEERRARAERMKRAKAFQRYQTLQRIEAETQRVNKLLESKAKQLERHRKANIHLFDHRKSTLQQMEKLAVNKKWRDTLSDEDKAKLEEASKNKKQ